MLIIIIKNMVNNTIDVAQELHIFYDYSIDCTQSPIINHFIFINIFTTFFN